jgi:hypothetical protein
MPVYRHRLYLSLEAPDIAPEFGEAALAAPFWGNTDNAIRGRAVTRKEAAQGGQALIAETDVGYQWPVVQGGEYYLLGQFVSDALFKESTLYSTTSLATRAVVASVSNSAWTTNESDPDVHALRFLPVVRVWRSDSSGLPYSGTVSTPYGLRPRSWFCDGIGAVGAVNCMDDALKSRTVSASRASSATAVHGGDRLVIEYGFRAQHGTSYPPRPHAPAGYSAQAQFGIGGADRSQSKPGANTVVEEGTPWWEFFSDSPDSFVAEAGVFAEASYRRPARPAHAPARVHFPALAVPAASGSLNRAPANSRKANS